MTADAGVEDLLRELAPRVLGVLVRRHEDFAVCEDAVQDALVAAAQHWPKEGGPSNPRSWLVTKGPGSRAAGVAMAFKLIESAQQRWRAVNAPHLVALVRAGARFEKGLLVERPDESGGDQQVA